MTDKNTYPNSYACEGCDNWDYVNGCWMDYNRWCGWELGDEQE